MNLIKCEVLIKLSYWRSHCTSRPRRASLSAVGIQTGWSRGSNVPLWSRWTRWPFHTWKYSLWYNKLVSEGVLKNSNLVDIQNRIQFAHRLHLFQVFHLIQGCHLNHQHTTGPVNHQSVGYTFRFFVILSFEFYNFTVGVNMIIFQFRLVSK